MTTEGIEAVFLETHNWGKSAKFFQGLGYEIEFATDHNSGQLRRGDSPSLFISEVPEYRADSTARRARGGRCRRVPARRLRRGRRRMGGNPLGHKADDGSGSRRPRVDAAGAEKMTGTALQPDSTAVRTALWRALHVEVDAPPHVLDDPIGLRLAGPDPDWRARRHASRTAPARSARRSWHAPVISTTSCAEQAGGRRRQYVILGAGLDTFAQRHPDVAARIFEVDQPGTQEWKRRRLAEKGYPPPGACGSCRSTSRPAVMVGRVAGQRFRRDQASGRRVDRRLHVPDQGGDGGDAAPSRRAGAGFDAGDDIHAAA